MVKHGDHEYLTKEEKRLKEDRERTKYWKRWGPYLSECVPFGELQKEFLIDECAAGGNGELFVKITRTFIIYPSKLDEKANAKMQGGWRRMEKSVLGPECTASKLTDKRFLV